MKVWVVTFTHFRELGRHELPCRSDYPSDALVEVFWTREQAYDRVEEKCSQLMMVWFKRNYDFKQSYKWNCDEDDKFERFNPNGTLRDEVTAVDHIDEYTEATNCPTTFRYDVDEVTVEGTPPAADEPRKKKRQRVGEFDI